MYLWEKVKEEACAISFHIAGIGCKLTQNPSFLQTLPNPNPSVWRKPLNPWRLTLPSNAMLTYGTF